MKIDSDLWRIDALKSLKQALCSCMWAQLQFLVELWKTRWCFFHWRLLFWRFISFELNSAFEVKNWSADWENPVRHRCQAWNKCWLLKNPAEQHFFSKKIQTPKNFGPFGGSYCLIPDQRIFLERWSHDFFSSKRWSAFIYPTLRNMLS